jgi:N-methylhydantoinase B
VLLDVLNGYVSRVAAREIYGVEIAGSAVDEDATRRLRADRPATARFHRQEYVDALD